MSTRRHDSATASAARFLSTYRPRKRIAASERAYVADVLKNAPVSSDGAPPAPPRIQLDLARETHALILDCVAERAARYQAEGKPVPHLLAIAVTMLSAAAVKITPTYETAAETAWGKKLLDDAAQAAPRVAGLVWCSVCNRQCRPLVYASDYRPATHWKPGPHERGVKVPLCEGVGKPGRPVLAHEPITAPGDQTP